ncbi:hypothetical protein CCACVL1_09914 [Corchorus capsularis]|uniref:BHLH domain-containing protein n=1 Tax=Corchorus capsularis TaxID=210143 RepID=A0A1R3ITN2_COCAP|nr:hypothetical protein CCACVL1_09914 [Corchorus capsularis]
MDDSMFNFHQQLSYSNFSENPHQPQDDPTQQDKILDYVLDHDLHHLPMDIGAGGSGGSSNRGSRRGKLSLGSDKNENNVDDAKKKLMHREIEKQRRQEMATLYSSLRTLLPLEYIKGKRAVSDHMNGAISYIKDLQKRIEVLTAKRDELKKLSNISSGYFDQGGSSSDQSNFPSSAVVSHSVDGVEVVISTGLGPQALTLSRVLQLLLEEGLDVVSSISTRIDGGLMLHTIQSEVGDMRYVDIARLEQKLNEEISSLSQIS